MPPDVLRGLYCPRSLLRTSFCNVSVIIASGVPDSNRFLQRIKVCFGFAESSDAHQTPTAPYQKADPGQRDRCSSEKDAKLQCLAWLEFVCANARLSWYVAAINGLLGKHRFALLLVTSLAQCSIVLRVDAHKAMNDNSGFLCNLTLQEQ